MRLPPLLLSLLLAAILPILIRLTLAAATLVVVAGIVPLLVGYLLATLAASDPRGGAIAVLSGGVIDAASIAALAGSAIAFAMTIRLTIGPVLDRVLGGTRGVNDVALYAINPTLSMIRMIRQLRRDDPANYLGQPEPAEEVGLGNAVSWLGATVGSIALAAMFGLALPPADSTAVGLVADGAADGGTWLAALFPSVVRTAIAAVFGVFAGAIWSIIGRDSD